MTTTIQQIKRSIDNQDCQRLSVWIETSIAMFGQNRFRVTSLGRKYVSVASNNGMLTIDPAHIVKIEK